MTVDGIRARNRAAIEAEILRVGGEHLARSGAAALYLRAIARDLGMAPWQVDKARRSLHGWSDDGLGEAIQAVAAADFDVKGGGRDPVYAVERAILVMSRARSQR